ncbi:MAG: adenylate/guanylate cyclase domain-containing protein [Bacteroidota bacterium]
MSKKRLLAAIMFTDIEGYTSLMSHSEENALSIRERHRSTFENTTAAYNGEIVQYFGDGTLSIFTSALEAVQCAIELQMAFLQEPKIPIRIGIHMGDILYTNDDIVGDAVNIASRIESCAVSGSVLISDKVHDQIRNHREIKAKFIDAYELKNVEHAMPLFAIANDGLVVPKREDIKGKLKNTTKNKGKRHLNKMAFVIYALSLALIALSVFAFFHFTKAHTVADDLSIAVLPFDNLSDGHESVFFSDGITEDILTQLSKLKELHVISRTSVMQYRGSKKTIPEIAKELGVSYILEGSIRTYNDDIRITAQLIDASTDEHIWSENYDRKLTNVFDIQTEVSNKIADALQVNLSFEEEQNLKIVSTQSIEAYKRYVEGRKEADKRTKESIANSVLLYKDAIAIDPNYAVAYAEIANSIYLETYYSGRDPQEAAELANSYLDQAEQINDKVSRIYTVRGLINNTYRNYEVAEANFKKAIALSPNDLTARRQYATFFIYTGQPKKQLEQAEIAYRLDPLSFSTGISYFEALLSNKEYKRAKKLLETIESRATDNNPFVINRSYFRMYMDQKHYKDAIPYLEQIAKKESAYNRFLGYCYVKTGDTLGAYRAIEAIKKRSYASEKNHQLAVVFAGLKQTDSVLFYLDTIRNKQSRRLKRENESFFDYLQEDERYQRILEMHGM